MTGLAEALDAEHAAIFAYGVIGVRLSGALAAEARVAERTHRDRRDRLVLRLAGQGTPAPRAAAVYALPFPVTDRPSALRLAIQVEERTAAFWRATLAGNTGDERRQALDGLTDCALRATRWRRAAGVAPATVSFPGRPA